jgi:hypothetical protein
MRVVVVENPKEERQPVNIRLPTSLMKKFRLMVVNEHGSYAGGWLSYEAERALNTYLLVVQLANEPTPEGTMAKETLARATP